MLVPVAMGSVAGHALLDRANQLDALTGYVLGRLTEDDCHVLDGLDLKALVALWGTVADRFIRMQSAEDRAGRGETLIEDNRELFALLAKPFAGDDGPGGGDGDE